MEVVNLFSNSDENISYIIMALIAIMTKSMNI